MNNRIKITRKELYDLVWSIPMTTLAKNYLITDSRLRQICKKMDIPLPKSGHWQKIQHGKEVEIIPLSLEYFGDLEVIITLNEGKKQNQESSPIIRLQKEIEIDSSLPMVVSEKLVNPDKLILIAKEVLFKQKPRENGTERGLVHTYRDQLSIKVSPENINRSLCFMDSFIKLIRVRGHKLIQQEETLVVINGEQLEVSIREKMKRVMVETKFNWKTAEDSPTGILCFSIKERSYRIYEFKDGKLPLEKQLSKILAFLETKSKEIIDENLKIKEYWEEERKKDLIKQNTLKQKQEELNKFKKLLQNAKRWQEAEFIRNYIDAVEKKSIQNESKDTLQEWVKWARKKADWYDPIIEAEDGLMQGVDKEKLTL